MFDLIAVIDETWYRQYEPDSMWWIKKKEKDQQGNFKLAKLTKKIMITKDSEEILLFDYLPKRTTMKSQYYGNLLNQVREGMEILCFIFHKQFWNNSFHLYIFKMLLLTVP